MSSRRDFIQKLTVPFIALPLLKRQNTAELNVAEIPYQGPLLRVAIMGLGSYGTRVAEAMRDCKRAKLAS